MHDPLASGIYESVVTQRLQDHLNGSELSAEFLKVPTDEQAHVYAQHIAGLVERHLSQVDAADRLTAANAIIERLADGDLDVVAQQDLLASLRPAHHPVPVRPTTREYQINGVSGVFG